ncbi:MAG: hypothetical protein LBQ75_02320, partial [Zoogloeaceae bacterium]|nr:hypothetical protein [Zoogloeaceae bacterium]
MLFRKLKQKIANLLARLLRAAVYGIVRDLNLHRAMQATSSSASLVDLLMYEAKPCSSRLEVMKAAFEAMEGKGREGKGREGKGREGKG